MGRATHGEVLVLAIAQHAHLHFLLGLHRAHLRRPARGPGSPPVVASPSSAMMTSLSRRPASAAGPPGAHAEHARAILAAVRIDLDSEHGAARPALDDADVVAHVARRAASTAPRLHAPPCRGARAPRRASRASSPPRLRASRVRVGLRFAARSCSSLPGDCAAPWRSAANKQTSINFFMNSLRQSSEIGAHHFGVAHTVRTNRPAVARVRSRRATSAVPRAAGARR